jgi:hypothetical protein
MLFAAYITIQAAVMATGQGFAFAFVGLDKHITLADCERSLPAFEESVLMNKPEELAVIASSAVCLEVSE